MNEISLPMHVTSHFLTHNNTMAYEVYVIAKKKCNEEKVKQVPELNALIEYIQN